MIFDCFLYNGEIECLKIRCEELNLKGLIHVLVQSQYTFSGKLQEIPISRNEAWEFGYNIEPLLINDVPNNGNAWDNEIFLRNQILVELKKLGARDSDIIIISDADEIPSCEAVKSYKPEMGLTALKMNNYWYRFNWLTETKKWVAPKIMTFEYLKNTTPDAVRNSGSPSEIEIGGWHFSYLGDADYIVKKLESFSHQEYNIPKYKDKKEIADKIENGLSLWGEGIFQCVPIDETFPSYLRKNKEKYKHLIKEI